MARHRCFYGRKIHFFCIFSIFVVSNIFSQSFPENKLVRVTGTVVDSEAATPIKASVYYEKLPHYDDIGIASTKEVSGVYNLSLLDNVKYTIIIKADGFMDLYEELLVKNNEANLVEKNYVLYPDVADETINLDNLIFARGKAIIDTSSYQELNEFVAWLKDRPHTTIQLEGHTDFQGHPQANMVLSQERVNAIKTYITKRGIKNNRISTKAFGGTQPLTKDRTPEAKASNRRVEVVVLQQ